MEPIFFTVVTGLLEVQNPNGHVHRFTEVVLRTYRPENTVICTWVDQRPHARILERAGFTVLYEDPLPSFVPNNPATRQSSLIRAGLAYALGKGATHVLRSRTDIECPNLLDFQQLLMKNYGSSDKLSVLCGIEVHAGSPYFLDVLVFGKIEQMIRMFLTLQTAGDDRPVEVYWMETYAGASKLGREDLRNIFNFFTPVAKQAGIGLHWHAKNYEYTLSDPCAVGFMWV
jgi:hypothetical protein